MAGSGLVRQRGSCASMGCALAASPASLMRGFHGCQSMQFLRCPMARVWIATAGGGLLRWDGERLAGSGKILSRRPAKPMARVDQVIAAGGSRKWILRGEELWMAQAGNAAPVRVAHTPELDAQLGADAEGWSKRGRSIDGKTEPTLIDRLGRRWSAPAAGGLFVAQPALDPQPVPFPMPKEPCTSSNFTKIVKETFGRQPVKAGSPKFVNLAFRCSRHPTA